MFKAIEYRAQEAFHAAKARGLELNALTLWAKAEVTEALESAESKRSATMHPAAMFDATSKP
jgi:hypothetical protein